MYLQLEDDSDNLSSGLLRGLTAVATGGASELVRRGSAPPPPIPCTCSSEKNIIQELTKKLRACRKDTGWNYKDRKIWYNPTTGIAQVVTQTPQQTLADSVVGSLIGATPYGAAAKGVLDIGKSLFGKKTSSPTTGSSADAAKIKALEAETAKQKTQITSLQKKVGSLKMQRYYYGGGGAALGFGIAKLIK
jgi:hypothetical protein